MKAFFCLIVTIVALGVSPAHAVLLESFESGLDGWYQGATTAGPDFQQVTFHTDRFGVVHKPTHGLHMLQLRTGNFLGDSNDFQTNVVTHMLTGEVGGHVGFDFAWFGNDYVPYNDSAEVWLWILHPDGAYPLRRLLGSVVTVGNFRNTPWQTAWFEFGSNFPTTSVNFQLEFYVRNGRDSLNDSYLIIDNIRTLSAIPEPASVMLVMTSLGLLIAKRNRRQVG